MFLEKIAYIMQDSHSAAVNFKKLARTDDGARTPLRAPRSHPDAARSPP